MNRNSPFSNYSSFHNNAFEVIVKRNSNFESKHIVHAVISDEKGRVLLYAGNFGLETFMRSSLKPFQAIPFITSGTTETFNISDCGVAISCGSHSGTTKHAREAFKILWSASVDVDFLKCPIPEGSKSRLNHNCSGKHAAFLATCKKMNWPLENYLEKNHPIQKEIMRRVAEFLSIPSDELICAKDDCGAPILHLRLAQMAYLYAQLANSQNPELEKINRAMISHPILIAGENKFDTELMNRSHGQIISKGGAEGIQCISRLREGIGLAIKAEDGSKRAKHAVALHILKELDWITPTALGEVKSMTSQQRSPIEIEVVGELKFQKS